MMRNTVMATIKVAAGLMDESLYHIPCYRGEPGSQHRIMHATSPELLRCRLQRHTPWSDAAEFSTGEATARLRMRLKG